MLHVSCFPRKWKGRYCESLLACLYAETKINRSNCCACSGFLGTVSSKNLPVILSCCIVAPHSPNSIPFVTLTGYRSFPVIDPCWSSLWEAILLFWEGKQGNHCGAEKVEQEEMRRKPKQFPINYILGIEHHQATALFSAFIMRSWRLEEPVTLSRIVSHIH